MNPVELSRLRSEIYQTMLFCRLPLRVSEIHGRLLQTGRWPTVTENRVRSELRRMVNAGHVTLKQRRGIALYTIAKRYGEERKTDAGTCAAAGAAAPAN